MISGADGAPFVLYVGQMALFGMVLPSFVATLEEGMVAPCVALGRSLLGPPAMLRIVMLPAAAMGLQRCGAGGRLARAQVRAPCGGATGYMAREQHYPE